MVKRSAVEALKQAAATLNQRSDELNTELLKLEAELSRASIGVSVWLEDQALAVESRTEDGPPVPYSDEASLISVKEGWILGYAKWRDAWRIVVKRQEGRAPVMPSEDDEDSNRRWFDVGDPVPLADAPRIIRAEAAPYLDQLIEQLRKRAEKYVENITAATRVLREDAEEPAAVSGVLPPAVAAAAMDAMKGPADAAKVAAVVADHLRMPRPRR